MTIRAYYYDADGHDRTLEPGELGAEKLGRDNLLWIDMVDPPTEELEEITKLLGLKTGALTDDCHGRSRLDNYGKYFRFSVHTAPSHAAHKAENDQMEGVGEAPMLAVSSQVAFIIAAQWLVTIRGEDVDFLKRFREQDKAETLIGRLTGQSLAASLLDWHLGGYFDEVSAIEAAADKLDERVLGEATTKSLLGRMVTLRRRVSTLRGSLMSQREVFYGLSRPDFALITNSGAMPFYEALVGRFERAVDEVERSRSVVIGSFELFTSRTSQQTNDLVKILTFLTAIVGFCAAIAGLMGMNFKLAFFETGFTGFALITGGLVAVAVVSVVFAHRRGWI